LCFYLFCRVLSSDFWEVVGRVLVHGFVLAWYWPIELCQTTITAALTGHVSTHLTVQSFLQYVTDADSQVFQQLRDAYGQVSQLTRLRVLSSYGSRQDVTEAKASSLMEQLALLTLVQQTVLRSHAAGSGLRCYPTLWLGVNEETLVSLYGSLTPSVEKILDAITPDHTEERESRFAEERVVGHLETFVASLEREDLGKLLVFWIGSNTLADSSTMTVSFNSLQGLQMRPLSATCSSTLTLSRLYTCQADLCVDMRAILSDAARVIDVL
jgi:hypothetical protein